MLLDILNIMRCIPNKQDRTHNRKSHRHVSKSVYRLMHQIGFGAYGSVYAAIHRLTNNTVAIKRVSTLKSDTISTKRLLREIMILKSLSHPNVVKILESPKLRETAELNEVSMVMEYAQNDLRKFLRSSTYLTSASIRVIVYNILCGMNFIHSANIIHRDLKPANILINPNLDIKICDFGLARSMPSSGNRIPLVPSFTSDLGISNASETTLNESIPHNKLNKWRNMSDHVTTRWYRAPEVILLEKNYTKSIDVWSMGCIISELCSMQRENLYSFLDRSPLFPGESCYPLSPADRLRIKNGGATVEKTDQLNLIFDIIGTPDESELELISDSATKLYIQSFQSRTRQNLHEKYSGTDPQLISLMENMLQFSPKKRISFSQALACPYFDEVRTLRNESISDLGLYFEFEELKEISHEELKRYIESDILI